MQVRGIDRCRSGGLMSRRNIGLIDEGAEGLINAGMEGLIDAGLELRKGKIKQIKSQFV